MGLCGQRHLVKASHTPIHQPTQQPTCTDHHHSQELLLNPSWLETKSRAYGPASVVADFRRYLMARNDQDIKILLEAFQRSAAGSCSCEGTLAVQMAARLMAVTSSTMIKVRSGGNASGWR